MLKITYFIKHSELARASLFFIERKTSLRIVVTLVNISALIILILTTLKLFTYTNNAPENFALKHISVIFFAILWLTMRKNINELLIRRRIKRNIPDTKQTIIEISENGFILSSDNNHKHSIAWRTLKKIFILKNGFIIPISKINFIWIPYHGFASKQDIEQFDLLCKQKNLKQIHVNWSC